LLQDRLFYESVTAALIQVVNGLGGCAAVGKRLWPSKPVAKAEQKLANCLNPEHEWKLEIDELVQILSWAREESIHFAMHKLCEVAGYAPPVIAPSRTPAQDIAERMSRHASEYARLADEAAALGRADAIRDVRKVSSLNDR
jgi:hypothetical protein